MIHVKNLFKIDRLKMINLRKNIDIVFEDDIVKNNCYWKDIIIFRYLLDFIYDSKNNTFKYNYKILSNVWIENHKVNGLPSGGTYLNIYSIMFREIVKPYIKEHGNNKIMDPLFKDMYMTVDNFNREFISNIVEYAPALDIYEILTIQYDRDLIDSMIEVNKTPTYEAIQNSYKTLDKVMLKPEYKHLSLSIMYNAGLSSAGQIRQMLSSRGFITELNNKIFNTPMTNSFVLGFKNIYEATIETRAGAKALYLSGKSIESSEYTNRGIQLLTMALKSVVFEDCGNRDYSNFYLKPDEFDVTGKKIYSSKLKELVGKRYFCDTDKVEKVISIKDKHLIGTNIKLRQVTSCKHIDKRKVCSHCIGTYGETIFEHQNLGNIATVLIMTLMSQGLLSAKHLLKTATSTTIKLNNTVRKYVVLKNNEDVYFRSNVLYKKTKTTYLKVRQSETWGLDNIKTTKDILSININKISSLTDVFLVYIDRNGNEEEITLALKENNASRVFLSNYLLSHIIKNDYEVYDDEYFLININEFNHKMPVFKYDKTEYSLAVLNSEFKSLIKSHKYKKVNGQIRSEYTPEVLINKIFELLNSELSVNIALIELLVYTLTVNDISKNDFSFCRGNKVNTVGGFKLIDYRSLGSGYDYDDLFNKIIHPMLYMPEYKMSNPMDVILLPNEVVLNDNK